MKWKNTYWLTSVVLVLIVGACGQQNEQAHNTKRLPPGGGTVTATDSPDGEQLFKINCSQCHQKTRDFTGPALAGVTSRWKDQSLLYSFIRNSQEVIAKDQYAKALFEKWNHTLMQPFPSLADEDIKAILDYCNQP